MNTRELFEILGFEQIWGTMTDQEPAYRYKSDSLELTATQVTNMSFYPVFLLAGVFHDGRTLAEINYQMPLEVESFKQGAAFVAYALRHYQFKSPPAWLSNGLQWADLLPWERIRREYEKRPKCTVEWEWFRIAIKKIRNQLKDTDPDSLVSFKFDGEVLRIKTPNELIALSAQGVAWDQDYYVCMASLDELPQRLIRQPVHLDIWEGRLTIGNRSFELVSLPGQISLFDF
ncbi:MAG: hypothetical protein HF981_10690 [Desulfobacteraceae bacterium]|nr:hypothetical protein [Desulfobacteraceae bacterium]MBC2750840.1 hypothetical protein [Desulfobacteraceae bacterium]